jgi:hypothetical protein
MEDNVIVSIIEHTGCEFVGTAGLVDTQRVHIIVSLTSSSVGAQVVYQRQVNALSWRRLSECPPARAEHGEHQQMFGK